MNQTEIRNVDEVYPDNVLYDGVVSRVDVEDSVRIVAVSYCHNRVCIWTKGRVSIREWKEDNLVNLVIK